MTDILKYIPIVFMSIVIIALIYRYFYLPSTPAWKKHREELQQNSRAILDLTKAGHHDEARDLVKNLNKN